MYRCNRRFIQWCNEQPRPDAAEAAALLRRAASMSPARHLDLESLAIIGDSVIRAASATPAARTLRSAFRNRNTHRDYGTHPQDLLADFPSPP